MPKIKRTIKMIGQKAAIEIRHKGQRGPALIGKQSDTVLLAVKIAAQEAEKIQTVINKLEQQSRNTQARGKDNGIR